MLNEDIAMNIMVKAYYDFDTLLKDIIAVDRVRELKDIDHRQILLYIRYRRPSIVLTKEKVVP